MEIMEKLEKIKQEYRNLSSQQQRDFFAYLIFFFSEIARNSYVEAGNTVASSTVELRAYNEMLQMLSKQNLVTIGARPAEFAYPPDILFDLLQETFDRGGMSFECFLSPIYDAFREVLRIKEAEEEMS